MDDTSSFYDEFCSYYGIQMPPVQTALSSLPPRPGASSLGPPPPIPFHSRPFSSAQLLSDSAPAFQSRNPFRTSPLAVPVPPFNPLPTNPFLRMAPPTGNGAESPATSSTGISDFNLTSPVPLEGHVPPFPNPFAGAAPAMTGLTQDQLLQALNTHFYNTNAILDHLQIQATVHATAAATSTVKKYIALPDGFDGHPKNLRVFKGQCKTYIQANAMAFQNDGDKKWFLVTNSPKSHPFYHFKRPHFPFLDTPSACISAHPHYQDPDPRLFQGSSHWLEQALPIGWNRFHEVPPPFHYLPYVEGDSHNSPM